MKRVIFVLLFVVLLLVFLAACTITGKYADEQDIVQEAEKQVMIYENSKPTEIYFCPRDDCADKLVNLVSSANKSVHCALFDLDLQDLIEAFDGKSNEIDVRVVVDNENEKGLEDYDWIRFDDTSQLSHNKFCVIDNNIVSTGSFNPTERCAYYNNNNFEIIYSEYLAKNYEAEFQELWQGNFGEGGGVEYSHIILNSNDYYNYFCPEDDCAEHVKEFIKKANDSIKFMTFSFTDHSIAIDIAARMSNNVSVQGIFESRRGEYSEDEFLDLQGADIRLDNNKYNLHHKVFIIDDKWVVFGSYNPTGSGDDKNDENIIITNDESVVSRFLEEFEYVWSFEWPEIEEIESDKSAVYISEVMYDPEGSDKGNEYVELFNPADETANVNGYRLMNEKDTKVIFGEIEPNSSLKITDIFTLKNSNSSIALFDRNLEQMDYVKWG